MWLRTAEVTSTPDVVNIRHEGASGPECRLRAALLRWGGSGGDYPDGTRADLVGLAWEDAAGTVYWGWPDHRGQILLRPGPGGPVVCSVLPPALSLGLALRRSGADLGARALVVGMGFLADMARAVAAAVGCRVTELAGESEEAVGVEARPDIVIETTGTRRKLDRAVERCADWGWVFSIGGGLTTGPFDYYSHVHCRALTLSHVPGRPLLCPGEEEVAGRGAAFLAGVLRGITPAPDEELEAQVLPEGTPGRLTRERSGWGLLLVEDQGAPSNRG